ncbi:MAG TPA: hypothetical protein VJN43_20805 [Bryobacteraceae bacterium]|nr:hypothetical protein [Bryobacteraceae bacterium]
MRRIIALGLVAAFSACYALPVAWTSKPAAANCCRRTRHGSCCHKSGSSGVSWTAVPECGQTCRLPVSLWTAPSLLVAPRSAALDTQARSTICFERPVALSSPSSLFAFLYQRPPPHA